MFSSFRLNSPLWSWGFRPFFLLAGLVSFLFIGIWLFLTVGDVHLRTVSSLLWHAHEMLFGFASAVLAGFLLTATSNWTGKPPVQGRVLVGLVILWTVGRLGVPLLRFPFFALVDLSFFPALMYVLWPYLATKSQKRNWIFLGILSLLFLANIIFYLNNLNFLKGPFFFEGIKLALNVFIAVILLIAGRVIPFFSSRVWGSPKVEPLPLLEKLQFLGMSLFIVTDFFLGYQKYHQVVSAFLFCLLLYKWWRWKPLKSLNTPMLWILFLAYLWIIIGFLLVGLRIVFPQVSLFNSTHAFTVGGLGLVTYGMMTRVALGHTGRPIRASRWIVGAYYFLALAAIVRVFVVGFFPHFYDLWILVAGVLWMLAFLVFLIQYAPVLVQPRYRS
ncbi:MAG: NnrS family protein [Bdellovibrio sp.]|nr:MAG: NnrS family protein [Bdellovibrio sp.]